jgi:uncharacterized protein (TIGR02265 family)
MADDATYLAPDWNAPLDLAARARAVPDRAQVRGMFFQQLHREIGRVDPAHPACGQVFLPLRHYPLRAYLELLEVVVTVAYGGVSTREAVRSVGRNTFDFYAASLVGKAILAVAGDRFPRLLEVGQHAYPAALEPSRFEVADVRPGLAHVHLRDNWDLPDVLHVGVVEGGLRSCGVTGEVRLRVHSLCDVDMEVQWAPP